MKKIAFSILLLSYMLIGSLNLYCTQTTIVDSLKQELENETQIEKKVKILNNLCNQYQSDNYNISLKYANEAFLLSKQMDQNFL